METTNWRLQERDLWILEGLLKLLFATTTQLARLFFAESRSAANKRLRKLLDMGFVQVIVRNLNTENVYRLTPKGYRRIANADQINQIRRAPGGQLDHVLLINDVHCQFATDLPHLDGELVKWESDWELRTPGRSLIPDAIFTIRWNSKVIREYTLEVDNETKSSRAFLQKILRYARMQYASFRIGDCEPITLVVARHERWLERYRQTASGLRVNRVFAFTTIDALSQGLSASIWHIRNTDQKYSLRGLESLPYGKDNQRSATSRELNGYGYD